MLTWIILAIAAEIVLAAVWTWRTCNAFGPRRDDCE